MKQTLGVIGAGALGQAVSRLAIRAGFDVIVSNSRGPESLKSFVEELGENAKASSPAETALASDFIFLSIPFHQIDSLPIEELKGKILIDATNYASQRDGIIKEITEDDLSASQYLQTKIPGTIVVKAFSNLQSGVFVNLAKQVGDPNRSAIPVASDQTEIYDKVATFIEKLGFDTLYAGSLHDGWRFEPGTPPFVFPYIADMEGLQAFLKIAMENGGKGSPPEDAGKQVTLAQLKSLLASSKKEDRFL